MLIINAYDYKILNNNEDPIKLYIFCVYQEGMIIKLPI